MLLNNRLRQMRFIDYFTASEPWEKKAIERLLEPHQGRHKPPGRAEF